MNTSFSKKRHILESNQRLENRHLSEQGTQSVSATTSSAPTISSIEILNDVLTPSGRDEENISVDGGIFFANCDANSNTKNVLTLNYKKLDADLVKQAIGDDTSIAVLYMSGGTPYIVYEQPIKNYDPMIRFDFPTSKVPNMSDIKEFAVAVRKGKKIHKFNGKGVYTIVKPFMF
jgi:hypothetical protein